MCRAGVHCKSAIDKQKDKRRNGANGAAVEPAVLPLGAALGHRDRRAHRRPPLPHDQAGAHGLRLGRARVRWGRRGLLTRQFMEVMNNPEKKAEAEQFLRSRVEPKQDE